MISPALHQSQRPYAPETGVGRLSSSAPALDLDDLHVSSRHHQQPHSGSPKLREQKQQPCSTLLTAQARLGCVPRPRRVEVGCSTHICKTLLSERRSSFHRRRPGRVLRRAALCWQHGTRLPFGTLIIVLSFSPPLSLCDLMAIALVNTIVALLLFTVDADATARKRRCV